MSYIKSSYAYRGERLRRIDRIRKTLIVVGLLGVAALLPHERPRVAEASSTASPFRFGIADARRMNAELDATKGQLAAAQAQLDRANAVIDYSAKYKVSADLAGSIYDIALAEGIEPDLGFRLVRVESEFHDRATSKAGALGLTQVMPATAKDYIPNITHEQLVSFCDRARRSFYLSPKYLGYKLKQSLTDRRDRQRNVKGFVTLSKYLIKGSQHDKENKPEAAAKPQGATA